MKRILKRIGLALLGLIVIGFFSGFLFMQTSLQFGGKADEERLRIYEQSPNFADGKFVNQGDFNMEVDCHSIKRMIAEMLRPDPNMAPEVNIPVEEMDSAGIASLPDSLARVSWFGHSTVLLELDGKKILIDPVFGDYAAPHPWLGRKRYNEEMPIEIAQLPPIDAIVISHDHYDHLDYESISELNAKTANFYVPLGIGNHLAVWGVDWERIHEMDWWDERQLGGIRIACTPSRHMSGRGSDDQFATLWGSWVFDGSAQSVYYSGDGGYGPRFKEIGAKYGPFDLGIMECGQYNELWADVHMMPEETAKAGQEVGAGLILPVHWGSFTLAMHSWTDPVERVTAKAAEIGLPVATPRIGQSFIIGDADYPKTAWWKAYNL